MSITEQLEFLRNEIGSVELETESAGAKAKHIRSQLKNKMNLKGLFYSSEGDEVFMNETLRSFLNINENGKNQYSIDDMDEAKGWFAMLPPGDNEHQHGVEKGLFNRNVKYCNRDGREAIFDSKGNYIAEGLNAPTYNYGYVANFNLISTFLGSSHGQYDMKPFFRQNSIQPSYWSYKVGTNYGFNSK